MEIDENICVCEICKLPIDVGNKLGANIDADGMGANLIYENAVFYGSINCNNHYDNDIFICNDCSEKEQKSYNDWFWGEIT